MSVNIDILASLAGVHKLAPATMKALAQRGTLVSHQADEIFFLQGDSPTGLFILRSGCVKFFRQSHDRVQILNLLLPGDWFGAESLPTDSPSPCTATALTPTLSVYIAPDELRLLLTDYSDFQEIFLGLVANRLKQFVALVHDLAFRDVASRLAAVLVMRAQREGQQTVDGICFERLLSQQEFAQMVGTAREVINRTFKRFEQSGLLRLTPNQITILDLEGLAAIASQEAS